MPLAQVTEAAANKPGDVPIHGFVADGFEPVAEQFARNFTELGDVGAAFSVVRHGETVVDLWAGTAAPGRAWAEDTLQVIFSGTKGLTATCMLMLVDRGQLDLEKPVAHYWPEFAANGKERLLVRDIVSHHSGLPGITQGALGIDDLADDQAMEALLAAQPLSPDPNAYRCYHALTIGWLCGGVLRRIDGRSLGRFFADEVAGPLGLDIWIGLPEAQEPRVGTLQLASDWGPWDFGLTPEQKADPTRRSIWANPPLFPTEGLAWNTRPYPCLRNAGRRRHCNGPLDGAPLRMPGQWRRARRRQADAAGDAGRRAARAQPLHGPVHRRGDGVRHCLCLADRAGPLRPAGRRVRPQRRRRLDPLRLAEPGAGAVLCHERDARRPAGFAHARQC